MQKHLVNIEFSVKTHKKQSRLTAQLQGAGGEMLVGCCPEQQSVTYQYREFPVPGIFYFFGGSGTSIIKIWYRKKVSELVLEFFVPEQIFVANILKF